MPSPRHQSKGVESGNTTPQRRKTRQDPTRERLYRPSPASETNIPNRSENRDILYETLKADRQCFPIKSGLTAAPASPIAEGISLWPQICTIRAIGETRVLVYQQAEKGCKDGKGETREKREGTAGDGGSHHRTPEANAADLFLFLLERRESV